MDDKISQNHSIILSRDKSSAIKGLLIFLVVLGHNHFFVDSFSEGCYKWLYSFHVALFFILPFYYPEKPFSWNRVLTNAKRLLWPYTYLFIIFSLISIFILKISVCDIGIIHTYITGDFYRLRMYIGFQYLWFLPAMFSMLMFKDVFTSGNKTTRALLIALGGICFVFAWVFLYNSPYDSMINKELSSVSILSCCIGCGVFFLGITTKSIIEKYNFPVWASMVVISFTFVVMTFLTSNNTTILDVCEWTSRIIMPIACMAILVKLPIGGGILKNIGDVSLPIYLFHQPINVVVCSLIKSLCIPIYAKLLLSMFIIFTSSLLISKFVLRIPVFSRLLLPR